MSDLISRQAALDAIERLILPQAKGETAAEEINRVAWRCAINCAEEMIGHLPTIEPKHGQFLGTEYDGFADGNPVYYEWVCSECGCIFEDEEPTYNFCPNCGAKMDEVEE